MAQEAGCQVLVKGKINENKIISGKLFLRAKRNIFISYCISHNGSPAAKPKVPQKEPFIFTACQCQIGNLSMNAICKDVICL